MVKKIIFDGQEYEMDQLSENAKSCLKSLRYVDDRTQELKNLKAVLNKARKSYLESLKQEILSNKAGYLISDD